MKIEQLDADSTRGRIEQIGFELSGLSAFGYLDEERHLRYDWHQHSFHQLLYSFRGVVHVEVDRARYFLPPQRAAWISAGTRHRTTLFDVESGSVFFHPSVIRWPVEPIRIIAAPPLLREMLKEAVRWTHRDQTEDPLRLVFFETLALLCKEWMRNEMPFWLPSSQHPQIACALDYTLAHLAEATVDEASAAAAMSVRTFRRYFLAEMGLSWRDYLTKSRLLQAMELLGRPHARVAEVACQVGFESSSAFAKAFSRFAGETPSGYQLRVKQTQAAPEIPPRR